MQLSLFFLCSSQKPFLETNSSHFIGVRIFLDYFFVERNRTSKLLAWCSVPNNTINITELENNEEYASFPGAQLVKKQRILKRTSAINNSNMTESNRNVDTSQGNYKYRSPHLCQS